MMSFVPDRFSTATTSNLGTLVLAGSGDSRHSTISTSPIHIGKARVDTASKARGPASRNTTKCSHHLPLPEESEAVGGTQA
jgi:hypothetical protein